MKATIRLDPHVAVHTLACEVSVPPPAVPAAWKAMETLLGSIARVHALNGFGSRTQIGPFEWAFDPSRDESKISRTIALRTGAMADGFWRILVGALAARGAVSVELTEGCKEPRVLTWDDVMRAPRILSKRPLPFDLDIFENPKNDPDRFLQITFEQPVEQIGSQGGLLEAVGSWNELLGGGFPMDDGNALASSSRGYSYLVDRFTIAHRVDFWTCHEEAYEVLFNIAMSLHTTMAPIQQIVIE